MEKGNSLKALTLQGFFTLEGLAANLCIIFLSFFLLNHRQNLYIYISRIMTTYLNNLNLKTISLSLLVFTAASCQMGEQSANQRENTSVSIQQFGVLPENAPETNRKNLQKAIEWAAPRGAALFVTPSEDPYRIGSGIILKGNVSIVGVHGPTPRGTKHPDKNQPVGSVFAIQDTDKPFITVETGTMLRGLQFWYPDQTTHEASKIIAYPPTIQVSKDKHTQGVTLSNLTFYGEYISMDFNASPEFACELILIEHCYGYPLGGEFIRIDYCYDIPRILHCHVNPAMQRFISGGYTKELVDAVIARKKFTYAINHTDNAQLMDVFTFGSYGGILLGPSTYGQLTNFNLDCVTVGIQKQGDNDFNRNWQIAQGSIIANTGTTVEEIHPIIIEGKGHTALSNVEAFSGDNGALTNLGKSWDFMTIRGEEKCTVSIYGSRMRNYVSDSPLSILNPNAMVVAMACVDKEEKAYHFNNNIK